VVCTRHIQYCRAHQFRLQSVTRASKRRPSSRTLAQGYECTTCVYYNQLHIQNNIDHTAYPALMPIGLKPTNTRFKVLVLSKEALPKTPLMELRYHHVNLPTKSCACYEYEKNDISCTNAFALILRLTYPFPLVFLPQFCSVQTWRDTYSSNFHPIVVAPHVLPSDPAGEAEELLCNPLCTCIPRGRPKLERYRPDEPRQSDPGAQAHLCSTCGQPEYNSHSCHPHD